MRVLVCGGRDYFDWPHMFKVLDDFHGGDRITRIIDGAATGADTGAEFWAFCRGIPYEDFPANWAKNGLKAGALRNNVMLIIGRPEIIIAFPGGPGTADMVKRAHKMHVPVLEIAKCSR